MGSKAEAEAERKVSTFLPADNDGGLVGEGSDRAESKGGKGTASRGGKQASKQKRRRETHPTATAATPTGAGTAGAAGAILAGLHVACWMFLSFYNLL